jgi:hypothetical protein
MKNKNSPIEKAKKPEKSESIGVKILKQIELVSIIASALEDLEPGQIINITPFALSIMTKSGSHPHVETVKARLAEADAWKEVAKSIKFHKNDAGDITRIEKLEVSEDKKEIDILKKRVDLIDERTKTILEKIEDLKKRDKNVS